MPASPKKPDAQSSLPRALCKLGYCSRRQADALIAAGRVRVNGMVTRDPSRWVRPGHDDLTVDGVAVVAEAKVYLALNKPRGLVTTSADEHGRPTVFQCLHEVRLAGGAFLPRVFPVGHLDLGSEGLLLFTNDTSWGERIWAPATRLNTRYHVQVGGRVDARRLAQMAADVAQGGDLPHVKSAQVLRVGLRNCWLEVVLDAGRNQHLPRLLATLDIEVLRLVRVAIGRLELGRLAKGRVRLLTPAEVRFLAP